MAKVKYNVGTFKGLLGTAIIYLAETEGGTQFLVHKASVTVGGVTSDVFVFTARSAMQSYLLNGDGVLSSNIDISKMADTAPAGVLDADGYAIISNGATVPRLYTSQAFYSIKGEGVNDFTGDVGTPVSGRESQTVVISSNAKTVSESITELVAWSTKNWYIVLAIAIAVSELLGWTNFLGLNKKKTARRRR